MEKIGNHPEYVDVGMVLAAPCPEVGRWVKVKVTIAAGTMAKCYNPKFGIDDWYDIYDLRKIVESPQ